MNKSDKSNINAIISVLIMVKNEEIGIVKTIESCRDVVTNVIILDTGSTDNTINVIQNTCKKHNLALHLKHGTFVDFSTSRNVLLEYAESVVDRSVKSHLFLLVDAEDELKSGSVLCDVADSLIQADDSGGYMILQDLKGAGNSTTKYLRILLIKPYHGWRYTGVVHEYIYRPDGKQCAQKFNNIVLYQDRSQNVASGKRFVKDRELLLQKYQDTPHDTRNLFYLAQTCYALRLYDEALNYYQERAKLQGYIEEKGYSYMKVGECHELLKNPWEESLRAYITSYNIGDRAEPIIKIAQYYIKKDDKNSAYLFINIACKVTLDPKNQLLFIDSNAYDYLRWHLKGIVSYYVGKYQDGLDAILIAIKAKNVDKDKENMRFYLDKLKIKSTEYDRIMNSLNKDVPVSIVSSVSVKIPQKVTIDNIFK